MVHSSLSKIGWVIGGAPTVVEALIETIGPKGTLVMPAATPYCLHPEGWDDLKVPEDWIPTIEEHLPVFEMNTTPTTMGIIPESFRNWPKTVRSDHPISSVCANGNLAGEITRTHNLEISEGKNTPYERVYEFDFQILLLGVGFNRCTMLHFAESRSKNRRLTNNHYAIIEDDKRSWVHVPDMADDNNSHFPNIGQLYLSQKRPDINKIGEAEAILFPAKEIVDFAVGYFDNRSSISPGFPSD